MSVRALLCGAFNYERHVPTERYYVLALDVLLFSHAGLSYVVHATGQRACNFLSTQPAFDFPHRARRQSAALTHSEMWFIILIISHSTSSKWAFHHTHYFVIILIHPTARESMKCTHVSHHWSISLWTQQKLVRCSPKQQRFLHCSVYLFLYQGCVNIDVGGSIFKDH